MFFRRLDLTSALRPSLYDDETSLFVQDSVGLYHGQEKLKDYENGHAYLTTHRVCYVDNADPRRFSVSLDLKDVDHVDFYAGFLKSSPKITFFPKQTKQIARTQVPFRASSGGQADSPTSPSRSFAPPLAQTRDIQATWICTICGFPNDVPANFDPATANQHTQLKPCQTCGVQPQLVHVVKAAIAAFSNRAGTGLSFPGNRNGGSSNQSSSQISIPASSTQGIICPRCTYENEASMITCEVCSASLVPTSPRRADLLDLERSRGSPAPASAFLSLESDIVETVKLAFRGGGEKVFVERLRSALVQRKWLLSSAPPIPTPNSSGTGNSSPQQGSSITSLPQRVVGIAGLEQKGALARQKNQTVIGTAFEDLEALMTSAKEVIAMAEQFRAQSAASSDSMSPEAKAMIMDSASALGLVTTKDMLGTGSSSETLYITELSRDLAEFLTDDRRGILRKEGGIISLVDLWALFNRTRNGIELVSPLDFEKAAVMWDRLNLPIRLRKFRSGSLVVQERNRTDEKTVASILAWLRQPQQHPGIADDMLTLSFGRGVTVQEAAEHFRWSMGVATEELEMAEDAGALCRDQCLDGVRFWQNHFNSFEMLSTSSVMQMTNGLRIA